MVNHLDAVIAISSFRKCIDVMPSLHIMSHVLFLPPTILSIVVSRVVYKIDPSNIFTYITLLQYWLTSLIRSNPKTDLIVRGLFIENIFDLVL